MKLGLMQRDWGKGGLCVMMEGVRSIALTAVLDAVLDVDFWAMLTIVCQYGLCSCGKRAVNGP